jgi:transposase-like protein
VEAQAMAVRQTQWLQAIQAAKQSGMTDRAWCKENGISCSTFYRWQRTLRDRVLKQTASQVEFVALPPVATSCPTMEPRSFVLRVGEASAELSTDISETQLMMILRVMRSVR